MRRIGWLVIAMACSAPAKPIVPANHASEPSAQPQPRGDVAMQFCNRVDELRASHCGGFDGFKMSHEDCVSQMREPSASAGKAKATMDGIKHCVVDMASCDATIECMQQMPAYDDANDLRACTDPADDRAVGVPPDAFASRNGAGVTKAAAARSTKDLPIEMCGIGGGIEWLTQLSCEDGSHPIANRGAAEASRRGNVGPGGRCSSIIDLYQVTCPERRYDIYVDGYICPMQ